MKQYVKPLLAAWCVALLPAICSAQPNYPAKTVRMIVGFPPGGSTDIMARLISPGLSEAFRQQFVIDNRPGANSNLAAELAAKAAADGYTLLVVSASFSTNVSLYPRMAYDPLRDFAPVTRIAAVNNVLVVHPSVPARTVKEFVALAKARPGEIVFASSGAGSTSHLAAELLKMSVGGLDTIHVPYKGVAPALVDLMGGQIHALVSTMPSAVPHIQSGRLRALAVASLKRAAAVPNVPTFQESGFPGFEASAWNAVLAPAGTSARHHRPAERSHRKNRPLRGSEGETRGAGSGTRGRCAGTIRRLFARRGREVGKGRAGVGAKID